MYTSCIHKVHPFSWCSLLIDALFASFYAFPSRTAMDHRWYPVMAFHLCKYLMPYLEDRKNENLIYNFFLMRNNSHIIKCKGGNRKDEMSFKHVQYLTNTFSFLFINIYIYIYICGSSSSYFTSTSLQML